MTQFEAFGWMCLILGGVWLALLGLIVVAGLVLSWIVKRSERK